MGRVITPRYAIHVTCSGGIHITPSVWRVTNSIYGTGYGKPTAANIDKHVAMYELSCIKGVNQHCGIHSILTAEIRDQHNGNVVVASWKRREYRPNEPMFMTIDAIAEDAEKRIGPIATKGIIAAAEYVKQYQKPVAV